MGVALYTAARVLRGLLGLAPGATILGMDAQVFFIVVQGLLTGIYSMLSGLLAVVWTERVQTVLWLVGAAGITVVGHVKIGRPSVTLPRDGLLLQMQQKFAPVRQNQ